MKPSDFQREVSKISADDELLQRTRDAIRKERAKRAARVSAHARFRRFGGPVIAAALMIFFLIGLIFLMNSLKGNAAKTSSLDLAPVAGEVAEQNSAQTESSSDGRDFTGSGVSRYNNYESILDVLANSWANANDGYSFTGNRITKCNATPPATDPNDTVASGETFAAASDETAPATGTVTTVASDTTCSDAGTEAGALSLGAGYDISALGGDTVLYGDDIIYTAVNSSILVIDSSSPDNLRTVAVITGEEQSYCGVKELQLNKEAHILAVISMSYTQCSTGDDNLLNGAAATATPAPSAASSSDEYPAVYTRVDTYDVLDPAHPAIIRTFLQGGSYVSSRLIGTTLDLVTTSALCYRTEMNPKDAIPSVSLDGQNWNLISAEDIYVVNPEYADSFTVMSAVTIDRPDDPDTCAVLGSVTDVYATDTTLYLASTVWDTALFKNEGEFYSNFAENSDKILVGDDVYKTRILSFSLGDGTLSPRATGVVPGILIRGGMNVYNGTLRVVATTNNWAEHPSANLTTLDENLTTLANVGDLSPTSSVLSVTYYENLVCLSTEGDNSSDLLYDTTDPAAPKNIGCFPASLSNAKLYSLGNSRVLLVGSVADEDVGPGPDGSSGIRISVYDWSDPAKAVCLSSILYGNENGESDATFDSRALLWDAGTGRIGLPLTYSTRSGEDVTDQTGYLLLSVDQNGQLKEDKWIPNPVNDSAYGDDRGILSVDGRTIFLLGSTQITAYNATDLAQLGTYTYPDLPFS